MLSKEEFLKLIEFIQKQEEKQEIFIKALDTLSPGTYNDCFLYSDYENKLVHLIREMLNDTDDELGYYLYDMEGLTQSVDYEYPKSHCPRDNNGNILYYSLSSLYDYIVNNQNKHETSTAAKGQIYFDFDTNEFKEVL